MNSKTVIDQGLNTGYGVESSNTTNTDYLSKLQKTEDIISHFYSVVDSEIFHDTASSVLTQIKNPQDLVKCAELASRRQPGGAFYRAKFWAMTVKMLTPNGNQQKQNSEFARLCSKAGIHPTTAKGYVIQGQAIESLEKACISTVNLREAPPELFKFAQRQKERASEYLIEAAKILENNPKATPTKIHKEWCQKNGSREANLDIIKPSDWWAFGHPKWRKEADFTGSIPGEVYANALYYFAPRTGIAIDPMTGSGMLKRVYDDRDRWQKDSVFNLDIHLFDLHPRRDFINKHDARKPLPIKADWIFIDPPYFGQSNHLFDGDLASAKDYGEYLALMKEVITALSISLNPGGRLCIFLPKWSGFRPEDPNHDVPSGVYSLAIKAELQWIDAAFVSRGRQQEPGSATKNNIAKRDRRMRSDTCVLNVFEKTKEVKPCLVN